MTSPRLAIAAAATAALLAMYASGCSDDDQKGIGESCTNNTDCADAICHSGICVSRNPLKNGDSCQDDAYCKSLTCTSGTCVQGSSGQGKVCLNDEECTNRTCQNGTCGGGTSCQKNACPELCKSFDCKTRPLSPDDYDDDGFKDQSDNCPFTKNKDQSDTDSDKWGDACDVCPKVSDPTQMDTDGDGIGDTCDADDDNDGVLSTKDNCPLDANSKQVDTDKNGKGDYCDTDDDNDGVLDADDNCPLVYNPAQLASDPNTHGSKCDRDVDKDNINDSKDNCPQVANADQKDSDSDRKGDVCDQDRDNDGVPNLNDNCPDVVNKDQADADRDGKGDKCDSQFCFVVYGDTQNCLDTKSTFRCYSPSKRVSAGTPGPLWIFINRNKIQVDYKWTVQQKPAGGRALLFSAQGTCSAPQGRFDCAPSSGEPSGLVVDRPGTYTLKLVASLKGPDPVNPAFPTDSSYVVTVEADGPASCIPDRCFK